MQVDHDLLPATTQPQFVEARHDRLLPSLIVGTFERVGPHREPSVLDAGERGSPESQLEYRLRRHRADRFVGAFGQRERRCVVDQQVEPLAQSLAASFDTGVLVRRVRLEELSPLACLVDPARHREEPFVCLAMERLLLQLIEFLLERRFVRPQASHLPMTQVVDRRTLRVLIFKKNVSAVSTSRFAPRRRSNPLPTQHGTSLSNSRPSATRRHERHDARDLSV